MDNVYVTVAAWIAREPVDSENEDDNLEADSDPCLRKKDEVQLRYESLQSTINEHRMKLESSLAQ